MAIRLHKLHIVTNHYNGMRHPLIFDVIGANTLTTIGAIRSAVANHPLVQRNVRISMKYADEPNLVVLGPHSLQHYGINRDVDIVLHTTIVFGPIPSVLPNPVQLEQRIFYLPQVLFPYNPERLLHARAVNQQRINMMRNEMGNPSSIVSDMLGRDSSMPSRLRAARETVERMRAEDDLLDSIPDEGSASVIASFLDRQLPVVQAFIDASNARKLGKKSRRKTPKGKRNSC